MPRSGLVAMALVLASAAAAEDFAPGTRDPRTVLPGRSVPRVLRHGPDAPYAAVLVEFEGTVTELYARDEAGVLWRVERPQRVHGRSPRVAVGLPPGRYRWVGFSRWTSGARARLYQVMDLDLVAFEVRPGVTSFAGRVRVDVEERPRSREWVRQHRWWRVHPDDFRYTVTVQDLPHAALAAMGQGFPWVARAHLPVVSTLLEGGVPVAASPAGATRSGAPRPGAGWGHRPQEAPGPATPASEAPADPLAARVRSLFSRQ